MVIFYVTDGEIRDLSQSTKIVLRNGDGVTLVTREEEGDVETAESARGLWWWLNAKCRALMLNGLCISLGDPSCALHFKVVTFFMAPGRFASHSTLHGAEVVQRIRSNVHYWSAALSRPVFADSPSMKLLSREEQSVCADLLWLRLLLFVPQLVLLPLWFELLLLQLLARASCGAGLRGGGLKGWTCHWAVCKWEAFKRVCLFSTYGDGICVITLQNEGVPLKRRISIGTSSTAQGGGGSFKIGSL